MTILKVIFVIALILIGATGYGATAPKSQERNLLMEKLRDQLGEQNGKIIKLRASIHSMEKRLGRTNKKFLKNLKAKKKINHQVAFLKRSLSTNEDKLKQIYKDTVKLFRGYLAQTLDDRNETEDLVYQKTYLKLLRDDLSKMSNEIYQNHSLQKQLQVLTKKFSSFKGTEETLNKLLLDLEQRKSQLAESYLNEVSAQGSIQADMEKMKLKKYFPNNTNYVESLDAPFYGKMSFPLRSFTKLGTGGKGVSFKFKGIHPVLSAGVGKVAYAGTLSTYGNVVMLDHGNEIMSVLVGQFRPKVQKGEMIKQDQVIGYTDRDKKEEGSLYFEIRKSDIALKSIHWLDKATASTTK